MNLLRIKDNCLLKLLFLLMALYLHIGRLNATNNTARLLNVVHPSASEEQKCLIIDKQGLIWIGTDGGLKSYDGYRFKSYRSDVTTPHILPNNTVLSLTEGKDDVLWIGTRNGLASMDKRTGKFTTHNLPGIDNRIIYSLFTSHDGKIWIGTDEGITCYLPEQKSFMYKIAKARSTIWHTISR